MVLEQVAGLDRLLVAPIDEDYAFAVEVDERNLRRRLGGSSEQCRHFGTRRIRILRPAGGLADVGVSDVGAARYFRKQRRLLGAAHDQRLAAGRRGAEFFELGPAELARGRHLGAATAAPHGGAVERHRVFARADQDVRRPIGHFISGWARSAMYFAVSIPQAHGPVGVVSATGRAMAATGCPPARGRHRARLWPRCVPRYNYYKQPSRVRDPNASARAPAPAHVVKTRARPAAAVSAGDTARGG